MVTSVSVAGSTGSVGRQTLEVVAAEPDAYRVTALAAGSSVETLIEQAIEFAPDVVAIGDASLGTQLEAGVPRGTEVLAGPDALAEISMLGDVVINGVVGFAGLPVTINALESGRRLGLANKESLIAAGPVVQKARRTPGAEILPVDSEHAAIHMCLRSNSSRGQVERLQITASGGPFRGRSANELEAVTVEEALNHPTWSMGPKITVDSSTLMNKGLEVIEANELFGTPAGNLGYGITFDEIDVVVHPQSIVHSMVTYSDGATIAQLSEPDMRLPVGYALAYPDRINTPFGQIDWAKHSRLDFGPPNWDSFPCLGLSFEAGRSGGTAPAWLSASNEVAVEAFLKGTIRWVDIYKVIFDSLSAHTSISDPTLEDILDADRRGREQATLAVRKREI